MKKIAYLLVLTATALLLTCGCRSGAEATEKFPLIIYDPPETAASSETKPSAETTAETVLSDDTETTTAEAETDEPQIILATIYTNYAWGQQQEVAVIMSDGKYSRINNSHTNNEDKDKNSRWVSMNSDDWYETLCDIAENKKIAEVGKDAMQIILDFTSDISKYENTSVKDYGNLAYDAGSYSLYGFYTDAAGEHKFIEICSDGDWGTCIDDDNVRKFANEMIENGIFQTIITKKYD